MLSLKSARTILNKYLILICNFVLVLYSTHTWGSEGRGIIALVITNISIIGILTNITSGSSIAFYSSKKSKGALVLISLSGAMLLSFFGSVFISLFFGWNDFVKYFLLSFLTSLSNCIALYYLGKGNVKKYNILSLFNALSVLIILSVFILIIGNLNIEYYFYSLYIGLSLSLLLGMCFLFNEKEAVIIDFNKEDLKDIIIYGLKNETSVFFQFLCFRLSYYMIAKDIGISELGVFSVAVSLVESIWVVSKSISLVHYASVINGTQINKNIENTRKTAIESLIISVALSIIIICIPNEVYTVIFGKDFSEIKPILIYLIPGCIAIAFSNIHAHYFAAIGSQLILIYKSIIGVLISVAALWVLMPSYKIHGVCIAMNLAYIIQSLYLLFCFNKLKNLSKVEYNNS
jgi:O-antigen/teichoic acid export membrane protein